MFSSDPAPFNHPIDMAEKKSIEVFQNLHLKSRSSASSIRTGILARLQAPWRHDSEREAEMRGAATDDEDVIVLVRAEFDDIDESALVLWQEEADSYSVSNIVPRHVSELGITKYNAILQDFADRIATPAAQAGDFEVEMTSASRTLDDWLAAGPADALRRVSRLTNKSTGAAHPMDRERWYAFLIATHRSTQRLNADQLARWLVEVENWPAERAQELAIDYESALGLLEQYDQSPP